MKKLCTVFFVAFALCSSSFADKQEDIKKLMNVSGSASMVDQIVDAMIPQYKQAIPTVPAAYWDRAALKMKAAGPDLINELVPIYDRYFTESEIKDLIKFYESPVGKKMVLNQPLILKDSMTVGQNWGMKIGQEIVEDLQKEGYLNQ